MNTAFTSLNRIIRQPLLVSLALLGGCWAASAQIAPMAPVQVNFDGSSDYYSTNFTGGVGGESAYVWTTFQGLTNSDGIKLAQYTSANYTNASFDFSTPGRQYIMTVWAKYVGLTGSGKPWGQLGLVNDSSSTINTAGAGSAISLALWMTSANNRFQMACVNRYNGGTAPVTQNLTPANQPINQNWYANKLKVVISNLDGKRVLLSGQFDQYSWAGGASDPLVYGETRHALSGYVVTNIGIATSPSVWFGLRARTGAGSLYFDNFEVNEAPIPQTPAAPASTLGNGYIALNWNFSPYALAHNVYRATQSGGPYSRVASLSITNTEANAWVTNANFTAYTDTGLVAGQRYYYVVTATNLAGETSYSSPEVAVTFQLAPQNLVATGGTNRVALTWSALSGATNYVIQRSDVSGGPYTPVGTNNSGSTVSYVDTGLSGGQHYYYIVTAMQNTGLPSGNSTEATAFTAAAMPANSLVETFTASVLRFGWTSPDTVPATTIIEASSDGVSFSPVGLATNCTSTSGPHRFGNVNHFYFSGLAPNTARYFRAYATNSTGFSPPSAVVSATTFAMAGININFSPIDFPSFGDWPIPGYNDDYGQSYGLRTNGLTYGWSQDKSGDGNTRGYTGMDERYRTYMQMYSTNTWAISLPNGLYQVHLSGGDPNGPTSSQFNLQGADTELAHPDGLFGNWWVDLRPTVSVTDGTLTISNGYAVSNNRLEYLDIYPTTAAANTIISQPQSQSVIENAKAEFSVMVSGGPEPYGYQWYSNTVAIPDANSRTYTIPVVAMADAGSYYVVVTNAGASINSSVAVLTVTPRTAPVLLAAGSVDGKTVGLAFDEALDSSAANAVFYTVNGSAVNVVTAELRPDGKTVKLALDTQITGAFSVTVTNILDAYSHTLDTATVASSVLGLTNQDIGSTYSGDSFTADNNNIEVVGGGGDIYSTADGCRYVYRTVDGDFDARVRVTSLTSDSNPISKAVLMARESTWEGSVDIMIDVNAPYSQVDLSGNHGRDQYSSDCRSVTDAGTSVWGWYYRPAGIPDCWIRLVRLGNEFRVYRSLDGGTTWIQTGSKTLATGSQLLLGLGVTAHNGSTLATGTFQGFTVAPPAPDVAVTKTASVSQAMVGGTFHYTVGINNQGVASASSVTVSDPLPAGLTYVSSSATAGSASYSAGTVTWNAGALGLDQSATLTVTVTAATPGTKVNTATATASGDDNLLNNSGSATVVVVQPAQPQLSAPVYYASTAAFGFSFASEVGVPYTVQYATNLSTPISWHTIQTIVGDGTVKPVQDSPVSGSQRYYRVLVIP